MMVIYEEKSSYQYFRSDYRYKLVRSIAGRKERSVKERICCDYVSFSLVVSTTAAMLALSVGRFVYPPPSRTTSLPSRSERGPASGRPGRGRGCLS